MLQLDELLATLPQQGVIVWLGVRPARDVAMQVPEQLEARRGAGLTGDRFAGRRSSKREVTFIQHEHVAALGSLLGRDPVDPAVLRRNIVVRGLNLLALRGSRFRAGGALFEGTGLAHPCSRMETALGPGGYNAMRGHGGITARILESGILRLGDPVTFLGQPQN
ncbi:MAG: MOSC domain-containing protein [Pseudomonadota bacterium]